MGRDSSVLRLLLYVLFLFVVVNGYVALLYGLSSLNYGYGITCSG